LRALPIEQDAEVRHQSNPRTREGKMGDSWVINPAPKKRRRSRLLGAIVGFVAAASLVAVAAWFVMPDSPGFGYGRAKNPAMGLQLVSVQLTEGDLSSFGNPIGPSETGTMAARWSNPNLFDVSITGLSVPAGSSIERVGDPSCIAGPSTFSIPPQTFALGDKVVPGSNSLITITMPVTTNANFPSCLAGGVFKVPVVAVSSLTTP